MKSKISLLVLVLILSIHSYSQKKSESGSPKSGLYKTTAGDNVLPITMSELNVNARSTYDLQSNGVCHYVWMEPGNANNIHAIFMTSTIPGTWDDRNTRYFYSSNGGATWIYLGPVGATRSGFPWLSATPDGRALISMHNTDGGGIQRGQLYVDAVSGAGSFSRLDPGLNNPAIWMICAGTNTKAFVFGLRNGADSLQADITTSFTPPGTWSGWNPIATQSAAQSYSAALGTGKLGVALITKNGGALITESTNEGVSWSSPAIIWTWRASDSTGALRSIDLLYEGANPRVLLGLGHVDPVAGTYNPGLPSMEVSWAPDINGGVPVTVEQAPGLNGTNPQSDVFFSCCRGTIGKTTDGSLLMCTFNKARYDTAATGNNFFDIYCAFSTNHGATWTPGLQLTNLTGQGLLADYRYPSISPNNPPNTAIITCQRDTVPGSNVNGAPASICRDMFIKITPPIIFPGVHNIGSEIPKSFSLQQNYPNPFNPSTKIRFELPKSGFVSIKLYDIAGKEVLTLVNENVSAGVKEVDFDGTNLASGIYFYTINAGSFTATKKMVLLK